MSVRIENLDRQTPVRKDVTKKVILAMKKYRQKKKLTADLLGKILKTTGNTLSVISSANSKSFLRLSHLNAFVEYHRVSLEEFLLFVDENVPREKLVSTYFDLRQSIRVGVEGRRTWMSVGDVAKLNALKNLNKTGEVGERGSLKEVCSGVGCDREKFFIPKSTRQKLISGIYILFSFSEGWQFWEEFTSELESEFLETGIVPRPWREKIADKTDLAEFVGKFQKEDKPAVSRRTAKKSSHNLSRKKPLGNSKKVIDNPILKSARQALNKSRRQKIDTDANVPMVVFRAFFLACFNAGVVKKDRLSVETLIGTLIRKLAPDFAVIFSEKDRKFIISGKGKTHTFSFKDDFPWEDKQ